MQLPNQNGHSYQIEDYKTGVNQGHFSFEPPPPPLFCWPNKHIIDVYAMSCKGSFQ